MILKQAEQFAWRLAASQFVFDHTPLSEDSGIYSAWDPGVQRAVSRLKYHREPDHLTITHVDTDDDYRHQGLATALLNRLSDDHPNHKINPGIRTEMGEGLYQHLQPQFKNKLVS